MSVVNQERTLQERKKERHTNITNKNCWRWIQGGGWGGFEISITSSTQRVPVPGGTVVPSRFKNYSHEKYSPRTLISVYCSSVQSTQHDTTNKQSNDDDDSLFPQA